MHVFVRLLTLMALVGTLALLGIAAAPPAHAHARLVASRPGAGETVDQPPRRVRLTFNEHVETDFARIEVTDRNGERVDVGAATVDGEVVTVGLRSSLRPGRYAVAFRVVSVDGHPVEADFRFTLAAAADPDPGPSPPAPSASPGRASEPGAAATAAAPSELPAAPTSTTVGGLAPWTLAVFALLAAAAGGGTYVVVRRRTGAP